jgi:hypothetical protein
MRQLKEALHNRAALEKNIRMLFETERMELERAAKDARSTAADQVQAANEQVRSFAAALFCTAPASLWRRPTLLLRPHHRSHASLSR